MKKVLPLLFILFFGPWAMGQVKLEYKLEKDDVFTIKQEAKQVITQELEGAEHELTNVIDGVLEFKVLGEEDENYEIALTFKDLNLKIVSSIQGELMNVAAKEIVEGDMQSNIFNSLLEHPIQMTLSRNGHILRVQGGDSLVAKMAQASGLEDEFSLNMMKKSLEKEFGSEALSNSYEQMTYLYPQQQVAPGDTWENEYTGKLSTKNTWTLETIEDTNAKITGTAEVIMDITEPATTMNLTGTQATHITTDLSSGFIKKMKVEGESKGMGTVAQLGDQKIPTTIKSTITYERIN
ncbi:DUF6263 family protein [Ulvibacterium marinum]|uniref:Uncharacterized protein n=1 Tax=Ulvibacterium marinum TaxID=2419782 RepID=A0A3B0C5E7_9FLAO|nr:DUF6263 family protein [Ulvibacterium marinum]RKN81615.1 hypothetical protein D7Z94_11960 [Ulvibacterium marinum]